MKKQLFILGSAIIFGFAACNDTSTTTPAPVTSPGDTTIQKTTTTTTTSTTTVHPIANFEHRTFMNVKTGKPVKLRVDTIHHYYVDEVSNQQPDYYYFDPVAHDTFDYRGRLLNNALIFNNGMYSIDESKVQDNSGTTDMGTNDNSGTTTTDNGKTPSGNTKIKQKDDMYKEKTDNSKMKVTDNKIKIKTQ